ncbi:HAD-IA family hydrolase [Colwellia sp. MEBiC06753]
MKKPTVKFYRKLNIVKALSFDLDDTLYSNQPVMLATEQAMLAFFPALLAKLVPHLPQNFDRNFWRPFRHAVINLQPEIKHDVSALRLATYTKGIASLGLNDKTASQLAEQAMAYFLKKRSDFTVPASSLSLLDALSQQYRLVAISNGNVDTKAIGLHQYFDFIYHAGNGAAKKPASDLFHLASADLALPLNQILHIGDCGYADITGALRAGMQAAWISCYDVGKPISTLPHLELTDITQLTYLLT